MVDAKSAGNKLGTRVIAGFLQCDLCLCVKMQTKTLNASSSDQTILNKQSFSTQYESTSRSSGWDMIQVAAGARPEADILAIIEANQFPTPKFGVSYHINRGSFCYATSVD